MAIDWTTLDEKTQAMRSLEVTKDPDDERVLSTVFSGLRVKLSELIAALPVNSDSLLAIWADTLVIDYPTFDARGVVVMAREIDASQFGGAAMPVRLPSAGETGIYQFMAQQTSHDLPLHLTTTKQPDGASLYTVPTGSDPLTVGYFTIQGDGSHRVNNTSAPAELQDLIGRPWALNSLKASFMAASVLMNSADEQDLTLAQSMLNWVVACIRALGLDDQIIPGDFAELYAQAAALLVTLNVRPGARYVPALSADLYQTQADKLLDALQSYQDKLDILDTRQDIQSALSQVGGALKDIADIEQAPLTVDMKNVSQNIDELANSIGLLQSQFDMQYGSATAKYAVLRFKITDAKVQQYLEAAFKSAVGVAKAGVAAGKMAAGDETQGGALASGLLEAATSAYDAIQAITKSYPEDSLLEQAAQLVQMQRQLITSLAAAAILQGQLKAERQVALEQMPRNLGAVTIDPTLAWDNYIVAAEATLTNLERMIGSGTGTGAAQAAATEYLASLKILAQYGKAINAKFVAYTTQLARSTVLNAQIRAAEQTQQRWQELQDNAKSDEEKLAALRGVLKSRADAIQRSLYVAWTHYCNAYFYLYFATPPVAITLDMSVPQLKSAFADIASWTHRLLDGGSSNQIQLPNDGVEIEFSYPIVSTQSPLHGNAALLIPATADTPASLELSIPIGSPQLQEQLPRGGKVAIWVTSAEFRITGVVPNGKGRVMLNASTSGAYENGYGPAKAYSFVTKGMAAYYGYDVASDQVKIKWEIDADVYMTPSPFTQWRLMFDPDGGDPSQATQLHVKLGVAFRAD